MTELSKECARLLARAESMRQAISDSSLPRNWERIDLDHMAEAGVMLWDQANDLALKEPVSKQLLSEAISLIFEPLLFWAGRFDLSARLAEQRGKIQWSTSTPKKPAWDPLAAQFSSLCHMGRFQDNLPLQRQATFDRAHQTYGALSPHFPGLGPVIVAQLAYGWQLMGLPGVALQLLGTSSDPAASKKYFLESNAPLFWQQAHINSAWIDTLRDLE